MTRKWRGRIFHVPHGVWYAIENSRIGIATAALLGFTWIDMDCHVTRDGVAVIGHWDLILKDHFELPDWFIAKYGKHPKVTQVDWADLQKLRTSPQAYRRVGSRRYRYIRVARAMWLIGQRKRLRLALEAKSDLAFEDHQTWRRIFSERDSVGLPKDRMVVMTLQNIGRPLRRLQAVKTADPDVKTVLLVRGPKPANFDSAWAPYVDYLRGSWR